MTTPLDSPDEPPPSSGNTSRLFVIGGVIVLAFFGLLVCAGAIAAPFILVKQSREARRAEAERDFQQAQKVMKRAEQERADREKKAVEPEEPDRMQSE
jgi:hypothetical protein